MSVPEMTGPGKTDAAPQDTTATDAATAAQAAGAPEPVGEPEAVGARPVTDTPRAQLPRAGRQAGVGGPLVGWQRLSARSMVVRPLTDLVRLLPLLIGLLVLHSRTGGGLYWGIAAAGAAVVTGLVHWATTRYLVTDERVYLRRGLLNTRRLSVARDRIRTVDVTAHLLHRVLGVCRITIGTGRNDLRPGESLHLDGLTRADAESLRVLLLATAQAPQARLEERPFDAAGSLRTPHSAATDQQDRQIARLRLGWLRFAPLTTTGLVVLGVLVGSAIQVTNAADVNLARSGTVRHVVSAYASLTFGQRILIGIVLAVVGYMLVAAVGYVAAYWNFRLVRHGEDTLRVTRGLLSLRATTISIARLRGVEISEPLLLRAARGARCFAITTGLRVGRGAAHEGSVLLPPAPVAIARSVAAEVLGISAELCSGRLIQHGPAACRRRYVRALAGAAVLVAAIDVGIWAIGAPSWTLIASLAALPVAAMLAADRYRSLGHRLSEGWLVTAMGSLSRRRHIIGTDAIIGWRIHQTWLQRRKGLITLTATTAAGHQQYLVRDVPAVRGLAVAEAATSDLVRPFLAPAAPGDQRN